MNNQNLKPWPKGISGNPQGRPASGLAMAELARELVSKHDLVGKLARIAARSGRGKAGVDQQLKAIALLLAYAFGPPKTEIALAPPASAKEITVTFVDPDPRYTLRARIDRLALAQQAGGVTSSDAKI